MDRPPGERRRIAGTLATHRPGASVLIIVIVTVILGAGLTRAELDSGLGGGFRSTSHLNDVLDEVEDTFDDNANVRRMQVLVDAGPGGDAIAPAAVPVAGGVVERLQAVIAERGVDANVFSYLQMVTEPDRADAQFAAALAADGRLAGLAGRDLRVDESGSSVRVGLILVIFGSEVEDTTTDEVVADLGASLDGVGTADYEVLAFEEELLETTVRDDTRSEPPRLMAIGMVLLIVVLACTYRSALQVVLSLVGVVLAIVWGMGASAWLGPGGLGWMGAFTPLSLNAPLILLGLAVDYGIQLNSRYSEERAEGHPPSLSAGTAVRSTGGALVLTTMTTMVGFGAGVVSPIGVIRDFSVILAVGVAAGFGVMVGLVPATRHVIDARAARRGDSGPADGVRAAAAPTAPPMPRIGAAVSRLTGWSTAHARPVLGVVVVLLVAGTWASLRVEATADRSGFLSKTSPMTRIIELLTDQFGGDLSERTYVVVRGGDDGVDDAIDGFVDAAAAIDEVVHHDGAAVTRVLGPVDGLRAIELSTTAGEAGAPAVADELAALTGPLEATGAEVVLTSDNLVRNEVNDHLADSGRLAIVIALAGAFVVMAGYQLITHRSVMVGALTVVSSGVVVVLVLGSMYLLDIALNLATITSASLAVGIGIDYSIHLAHRFQEEARGGLEPRAAIDRAATTTGGALLASALTTIVGIGTLALSSVPPIADYGRLNAIAISTAFLAALVVQPALLVLWTDRTKP